MGHAGAFAGRTVPGVLTDDSSVEKGDQFGFWDFGLKRQFKDDISANPDMHRFTYKYSTTIETERSYEEYHQFLQNYPQQNKYIPKTGNCVNFCIGTATFLGADLPANAGKRQYNNNGDVFDYYAPGPFAYDLQKPQK